MFGTATFDQLLVPARQRQATSLLPKVSGVEDLPAPVHVDLLIRKRQDLTLLNVPNRVKKKGGKKGLLTELSCAHAIIMWGARMVYHLQPTGAGIVLRR